MTPFGDARPCSDKTSRRAGAARRNSAETAAGAEPCRAGTARRDSATEASGVEAADSARPTPGRSGSERAFWARAIVTSVICLALAGTFCGCKSSGGPSTGGNVNPAQGTAAREQPWRLKSPGDPSAATDPCAMRMTDICGMFLAYYVVNHRLPDTLDELKPFADEPGFDFTCPVSHQPYVYVPGGLRRRAGQHPAGLRLHPRPPRRPVGRADGPGPPGAAADRLLRAVDRTRLPGVCRGRAGDPARAVNIVPRDPSGRPRTRTSARGYKVRSG